MDKIRVLQFSTHNEECGIAKYQEQFVACLSDAEGITTEYFKYSPNQTKHMSAAEFSAVLEELKRELTSFDILHIQHEISFFNSYELEKIINSANGLGKRVIVTVHTDPQVGYIKPHLGGLGLKSFMHYFRAIVSSRRFLRKYVTPLKSADTVLVHNKVTQESLVSYGVELSKIKIIPIPVPEISFSKTTNEIKKQLKHKDGDVIYCSVGFLSKHKGVLQAVKALSYLPDNYKLAIIGGNHPNANDEGFYNEVTDLITELNLRKRVYITGYVAEDERLNSLIRECDICVYPFDKKYYSYVSSASLNNAFANHKPVIAYPTKPFLELNEEKETVNLCATSSYYELAREISSLDIQQASLLSQSYAERYAYDKEAKKLANTYLNLIK